MHPQPRPVAPQAICTSLVLLISSSVGSRTLLLDVCWYCTVKNMILRTLTCTHQEVNRVGGVGGCFQYASYNWKSRRRGHSLCGKSIHDGCFETAHILKIFNVPIKCRTTCVFLMVCLAVLPNSPLLATTQFWCRCMEKAERLIGHNNNGLGCFFFKASLIRVLPQLFYIIILSYFRSIRIRVKLIYVIRNCR